MYHFVQYLYHFIFILLWHQLVVPCLDNIFMVCWSLNLQKLVQRNLFFWILVLEGGRGVHTCVGMFCYHCIVHTLNSSKKLYFFFSLTAICAVLCCQTTCEHIPLLCAKLEPYRRHWRSKTMAKVFPKSWFWMHAFDWPEQTLKIHIQYSTYFACNNDLCRGVLTI